MRFRLAFRRVENGPYEVEMLNWEELCNARDIQIIQTARKMNTTEPDEDVGRTEYICVEIGATIAMQRKYL